MRKTVMALSVLLIWMACAPRPLQTLEPRDDVDLRMSTMAVLSESWGGFTWCGTKPGTFIEDSEIDGDSVSLRSLRIHEKAHRDWIAQFPSCAAWWEWMEPVMNNMQFEAFAFCLQARYEYSRGKHMTLDYAFRAKGREMTDKTTYKRWPFLTPEAAADYISIACKAEA